ncbi:MAG: carbonic anhydrase family protein [Flavobacteriaceae bacterium]|nr:carbonic anhydrase family protein [Flavobacteriaceae bacterium]MDP4793817.1 carbonic anhydrase family protein [Flavobacteriaceae bacterium]MDP4886385.1 carbonic anhydrase family protein [Flavobacteriaceae bacterium]MDP4970444.1 carbonic anhydrase family protein [Flavobacteriaceae bacterium]
MKTLTAEQQARITPDQAVQLLRDGNKRFVENTKINRNLMEQVNQTSDGQYPFATILSCIDSRVSAELIFDQGIGDVFSIRIAGNIVNKDILGSMEFASKVAGTKAIVVLGHTNCGAVKGACDGVELGNLTHLLDKITPAMDLIDDPKEKSLRNSKNIDFVDAVANANVDRTVEMIRKNSPILAEMEQAGAIKIVSGMYDIQTGVVTFHA